MNLEPKRKVKINQKRNRLIIRSSILFILIGAVIFTLISNSKDDNMVYRVGDKAPDFKLTQINENNQLDMLQLSDLEGKGVMLNFWATWCKPCEEEMPYMQELYPKYKDKGVEIVAVSLDSTELVVNGFVDKYDLTFPIPHDQAGEIRDLYKVGPLPSTFFINPDGEIEEYISGALSLESLESYLQDIMPQE